MLPFFTIAFSLPEAVAPALVQLPTLFAALGSSGEVSGAGEGGAAAWTLLIVYVSVALVVSFMCSILEAALLSARLGTLETRRDSGDRGAELLLDLKRDRLDDAISSILILNTLAHTFGVAGAGIQAQRVFSEGSVVLQLFPVILTILILVLTEIIPKTIGAVYAERLVGPVARLTNALIWMLRPALFATNLITRAFTSSAHHQMVSRGELAAMVSMAARQGTLAKDDSRLLANVLRYDEIQVSDVMTPRTVAVMMPVETTVSEFLASQEARPYSRLPLYRERRDEVFGYLLARQVLRAAARGIDPDTTLEQFRRSVMFLPETLAVSQAIRKMTEEREHLAMVTDEYGGISGLVTMEDLMETVLGVEILDESDRVVDLREEAARVRDRRLQDLRRMREAEMNREISPAADGRTAEPSPTDPT
ncbi:MAG: hemolysin family protein [Acidobacteriota bacterium]